MSQTGQLDVEQQSTARGALSRLGLKRFGPTTIAVHAEVDTDLTPEQVWESWHSIENWTRWSRPWISSARWLEKRDWEFGATFEMSRHFGWPLGNQNTVETVREVNPGRSVSWWDGRGGIRSCCIWTFDPLPNGGTRIAITEVFCGFILVFIRPFMVKPRWRWRYQTTIERFVKFTKQQLAG